MKIDFFSSPLLPNIQILVLKFSYYNLFFVNANLSFHIHEVRDYLYYISDILFSSKGRMCKKFYKILIECQSRKSQTLFLYLHCDPPKHLQYV